MYHLKHIWKTVKQRKRHQEQQEKFLALSKLNERNRKRIKRSLGVYGGNMRNPRSS